MGGLGARTRENIPYFSVRAPLKTASRSLCQVSRIEASGRKPPEDRFCLSGMIRALGTEAQARNQIVHALVDPGHPVSFSFDAMQRMDVRMP